MNTLQTLELWWKVREASLNVATELIRLGMRVDSEAVNKIYIGVTEYTNSVAQCLGLEEDNEHRLNWITWYAEMMDMGEKPGMVRIGEVEFEVTSIESLAKVIDYE